MAEPQAARPAVRSRAYAAARKRPSAKKSSFDWTPGRTKKYPPPIGLIYSSSCSPLRRDLHGEKACGEIGLEADEQEPHVELAGGGHAARKIVAPAQDPARLSPGRARIGEADVGGEGHPRALRIGRIIRDVVLVRVGERRAARLFATDDLFLVDQRVAIPALDENADDADDLIGSASRPSRVRPRSPASRRCRSSRLRRWRRDWRCRP